MLNFILNGVFCLALGICLIGFGVKGLRLLGYKTAKFIMPAPERVDAPPALPWRVAVLHFLAHPAKNFHHKSSRAWTCGYIFYHTAIFMVVFGYAVSLLMLLARISAGTPVPVLDGPPGTALAPANLLALIFGNAETLPSSFLFGKFSAWFRGFAACELPFAVIGNLCLLYSIIGKRQGAVRHDLDEAAREIRLAGKFSGQHLFVRLVIFGIIGLEFAGRFSQRPAVAYCHALLGMCLIAALPLTYLAHIPLMPLAAWLAVQRRRRNALA